MLFKKLPGARSRVRPARWVGGLTLTATFVGLLGVTVTAQQPETQMILLTADGESRIVENTAETVGALLTAEKVFLNREDRCSLPLPTPLKDEMRVVVTRVTWKKTAERIPIKNEIRERFTSSLRAGATKVVQAGREGERVKTFLETYKDGVLASRKKVAEKVTPPRTHVVIKGTRGMLASRGYFSGRRIIEMRATGYGPGRASNGRWAGQTATGLRPGYGVVAVDPRFIPLGTRLYIEGYGYAVAGDTGGAIKGNRIDLGYDTQRQAMRVGRKKVKVLILK